MKPENAKATVYNGIEHRSFSEAVEHNILNNCGFDVLYEAYRYPLPNGTIYRPDFYSIALDLFIEEKGYTSADDVATEDVEKITLFRSRQQDDDWGVPETHDILIVGPPPLVGEKGVADMSDADVFYRVYVETLVAYNKSSGTDIQYYSLNGTYSLPCYLLSGKPGFYNGPNKGLIDIQRTGRIYKQALTYRGYATIPLLKRSNDAFCSASEDALREDLGGGEEDCLFEVVDAFFYVQQDKGKRNKQALKTLLNVYGKSGAIYRADNNVFFWQDEPESKSATKYKQHFLESLDRPISMYSMENIQKSIVGAHGCATFKIKGVDKATNKRILVPKKFSPCYCLTTDKRKEG